jgi:hypothetical protein
MTEECEASKEWARHHLACRAHGGKGVAAVVHAEAQLPLSPGDAFQLMAHPDNAQIFRGIERCTFRKVLWAPCAAGRPAVGGRQTVEVENESGGCCKLLGLPTSQHCAEAFDQHPPHPAASLRLHIVQTLSLAATLILDRPTSQTGTFCSSRAASAPAWWWKRIRRPAPSACGWHLRGAPRRCST